MVRCWLLLVYVLMITGGCLAGDQDNVRIYSHPNSHSIQTPNLGPLQHTVKAGDTLWNISRRYGAEINLIKTANRLKSDLIYVGQVLSIPQREAAELPAKRALPVTEADRLAQNHSDSNTETKKIPPSAEAQVQSAKTDQNVHRTTGDPVAWFHKKLFSEVESLAKLGIAYNDDWHPPGENNEWLMDCSNTTRYIYRKVAGIEIGRTASDQYYFLSQKNQAWEVPIDDEGRPDLRYLEQNLRVGDLLFWENTYKPRRDPPITHVMIFLGKNKKGDWIMAGSQSGNGGALNPAHSGPDIYRFDPCQATGGYYTWLGFVHVRGKFVAYGRPMIAGGISPSASHLATNL